MDYSNFDAMQLQEMSCDYIGKQKWVQDILCNMLEAARSSGVTFGHIYEKDHPELKDETKRRQLVFFLRHRGILVHEGYEKNDGKYLTVDWNFTPTAKKFYDILDDNKELITSMMNAAEGLIGLSDIIGAGIVAWMNGRGSVTSANAESYIVNSIAADLS